MDQFHNHRSSRLTRALLETILQIEWWIRTITTIKSPITIIIRRNIVRNMGHSPPHRRLARRNCRHKTQPWCVFHIKRSLLGRWLSKLSINQHSRAIWRQGMTTAWHLINSINRLSASRVSPQESSNSCKLLLNSNTALSRIISPLEITESIQQADTREVVNLAIISTYHSNIVSSSRSKPRLSNISQSCCSTRKVLIYPHQTRRLVLWPSNISCIQRQRANLSRCQDINSPLTPLVIRSSPPWTSAKAQSINSRLPCPNQATTNAHVSWQTVAQVINDNRWLKSAPKFLTLPTWRVFHNTLQSHKRINIEEILRIIKITSSWTRLLILRWVSTWSI